MYSFKRLSPILFFFVLFQSCTSSLPSLEGIDLKLWKEDRNGCNGNRSTMMDAITEQKEKLKALSEMDIIKLLGKPDENDLLQRGQKFYVYYLEEGPGCDQAKAEPKKLILRMNAMSLTKEVQIK